MTEAAERLRAYRQDLRLSQTDLARRSDVSRFKINQYETGAGKLTDEELLKIEAALQHELERLRQMPSPAGGNQVA